MAHRRPGLAHRVGRCLAGLLLASCLCAAADSPRSIAADALAVAASRSVPSTLDDAYVRWFQAHVQARIIPVAPPQRAPYELGPWEARQEFGVPEAHDDGSLTEWADHYFITHDWSDYGYQILCLAPGDTVYVNGMRVVIEGVFNYPKDSYLDEIREATGQDAVVFQTCYPDSDLNRIAYGSQVMV